MKESILLQKIFEHERWDELYIKANEKGINFAVLRQLSNPFARVQLYNAIVSNQYEVAPPHIARIPKDNGDYREVFANEDVDRLVLTLINDVLCETFFDMIHPSAYAYQKGKSCQETVQKVSKEICNLDLPNGFVGYKADLSKYFDSVRIEIIDNIFNEWETCLGFEKDTEPVINLLRRYYHNDWVFDFEKNLVQHYGSLKQGCAVAAILANVVLYDVDEILSNMNILYYRYSDDILMIGPEAKTAKAKLESMLPQYGLSLNPKKVEEIYKNKWFTFLGFNIKGDQITLSKNRVKKLTRAICEVTVNKPNISPRQAIENVRKLLYGEESGYSWATACFNAMQNCEKDVETLNNFIMDCIRLCDVRMTYNKRRKAEGLKPRKIIYGMDDIGGIGVVHGEDYTLVRGKGKKIRTAHDRTEKEIEYYKSLGCMLNAYKLGKPIYEACVRNWR